MGSPEKKNYADFLKRLDNLLNYYQKEGYHYAKHILGVTPVIQPAPKKDGIQVELLTVGDGKVYYTTMALLLMLPKRFIPILSNSATRCC